MEAGVNTIEHGYEADVETLKLIRDKNVVLCPTLAASEAMPLTRVGNRANPILIGSFLQNSADRVVRPDRT